MIPCTLPSSFWRRFGAFLAVLVWNAVELRAQEGALPPPLTGELALTDPSPDLPDTVYHRLYREFARHPHRIVGSENLSRCFEAIEEELRAAGLEPARQTFSTLVQTTDFCRLSYGGTPVEGALALDYGVASWVSDEPLQGKVFFAGSGGLQDLEGLEIRDRIAVVDMTLPGASIHQVFLHGAQAVILVGDESLDQWTAARFLGRGATLIPSVYVHRSHAEAAGLLSADGTQRGSLEVRSRLVDVTGTNLYVVLPGTPGWQANLGAEEVLVFSASLDTYGFTPDYSPDLRRAANAALLADVACALANEPRNRTLVMVFFGAHYSLSEDARHFYYAVDMAEGDGLDTRQERLQQEMDDIANLLQAARREDVLSANDQESREIIQRFRRLLMAFVNRQRDPVGRLNRERMELLVERSSGPAAVPGGALDPEPVSAERLAAIEIRLAEIDAALEAFDQQKRRWNDLQGQIATRRLNRDDAANLQTFQEVRDRIIDQLLRRQSELEAEQVHNRSSLALSQVFSGRTAVAHFDFDFASDGHPWLLSMINAYGAFRHLPIDTGSYLPYLTRFGEIYAELASDVAGDAPLFTDSLTPFYKPFSLSVPSQRQVSSMAGISLGIPGFQLMTVGDALRHDALPFRAEHHLTGLAPQMRSLIQALADDLRFSLRRVFSRDRLEDRFTYLRGTSRDPKDIAGVNYVDFARASSDPEGVARNAVAVFSGGTMPDPLCGQSLQARTRILANGFIHMPMINRVLANRGAWGSRIYGFGYDAQGRLERVSNEDAASGVKSAPVPLFYAHGGLAFSYGYAPDQIGQPGDAFIPPRTLLAQKDSRHKNFANVSFHTQLTEFFADLPDPIKRIGTRGELLLGATREAPLGLGVPIGDGALLTLNGIAQGAHDYWQLNDMRLRVLRQRNIISDDLEALHADVREHLDSAGEAAADRSWLRAQAHQVFATALAYRVYGPLRGITEDLVHAVVVLLLLNIPFAFALERLLFGFTSIYRQVMGFVGFFLATFAVLFLTHPAFSLAAAPIIIFLAFVIILLSSLTVAIVMGKIRQEIRAIQGLASTVHGVDSDNSTSMAAILIGIAGMRNRPLKTFLTSVTVVLLTFTILVFASFSSRQGVVETYLGKGSDADRIELHRFSFLDIDKPLVRSIQELYGDRFHVFGRGGLFRNPTRSSHTWVTPLTADFVFYLPRNGKVASISTVMGLDPDEFEQNDSLAEVAPGFRDAETEHPPLFLSDLIAETLEVVEGDQILLNGQAFTYAGQTQVSVLQHLSTIDDFRIMPPNLIATTRNAGGAHASSLEEAGSGSFEWFSPNNVALARIDDLERMFPTVNDFNYVLLYPRSPEIDIEQAARELAPVFNGSVHVKSSEGARRMFFTRAMEGSGLTDVLVPLLLGGLIIFSSLMGSIVDREREIFTYSALGLSPPDVGALFFAESAVYSVIGGMGGYLLSQVVAKILNTLGSMGLVTPPEMNFSSLTSVLTILIVMAVVMLSTIFPAIKAGRSANPGVARKWKMPAPNGDHMRFVFPFTVSELDFAGILSFIREHFQNHGDATLGNFAAKEVKLFRLPGAKGGGDAVGIEANISLAPFDLGIFQRFRMYSSEFEIQGIDEVVVELERIGGTPPSWIRSNRAFADELRQQFLLWRSLPIETIEHYRAETARTLGGTLGSGAEAISEPLENSES